MPLYLLLPLLSTILIVMGFMLNKRAMANGADAWSVTFVANLWAAAIFALLLLLPGEWQPWHRWWQPLIIALLYILGQLFTFLALQRGDVSIATPVFSVKVLSVAFLATLLAGESLSVRVWAAAAIATLGIALVQASDPGRQHRRVLFTIVFALLAAATFSLFDVVIQVWSQDWDATRLLPLSFALIQHAAAACMSLGFLPVMNRQVLKSRQVALPLLAGTLMIGMQAFCIVYAIGTFGDVTRINIVYALRGLWGVVLAWCFARVFRSGEAVPIC